MCAAFVVKCPHKARYGYIVPAGSSVIDFFLAPETEFVNIIEIKLRTFHTIERSGQIGRDRFRLD